MTHQLSDNALKFRALILAEIEKRNGVTKWRTWEQWKKFSGFSRHYHAAANNEIVIRDKTLKKVEKPNSWRLPVKDRKYRWELRKDDHAAQVK